MSQLVERVNKCIEESISVKQSFSDELKNTILQVVQCLISAHKNGKRVLVAGNGGSAADAQHFAAELVGRFYKERQAMDVMALSTNSSTLTCLANDYPSSENLFSRQIEAYARPEDVFVGISTSGNSPNIIKALEMAKNQRALTIGLTGQSGGKMTSLCDILMKVPSDITPRIQESHILIIHIICELVEEALV